MTVWYIDMPPAEIERLLESQLHEVRAGGCSIMAKQAARKRTPESRRADLYALYLRRHDRINNWDLVDLAARDVVGGCLAENLRDRRAPAGRRRGLIHKAVGGWLRGAGKKDRPRLLAFLDEHAAEMPRTMLRYAPLACLTRG